MSKKQSVSLYTPVYRHSPGTQYRIDLLATSLRMEGFRVRIVADESESALTSAYRYLAPNLLSKKTVWRIIGKRISDKVLKHRSDVAILFTDIAAGGARYLAKKGVKTVISLEDLTVTYHPGLRGSGSLSNSIMKILGEELAAADKVITSAFTLSERIRMEFGLSPVTVPIGLQPYVTDKEALQRNRKFALHARQIQDIQQASALTRLARYLGSRGITVLAHRAGKFTRDVKGVSWYHFGSAIEAIGLARRAFIGIVSEFRPAFTLSSLYFHTGLIQPVIPLGAGPWLDEASNLGIPLVSDVDEVDKDAIRTAADASSRLQIPKIHRPLLDLL